MKRATLALTTALVLAVLPGCANDRQVSVSTYTAIQPTADSGGWYKYPTYWFKGSLANNQPEGSGLCHTLYTNSYAIEYSSSKTEWVDAPCEFSNGKRVDAYHQARLDTSIEQYRQQRQGETAREREQEAEQAAYRRVEAAKQRAAANEAMAAVLANAQAQGAQIGRTLAQSNQQISSATQQANQYNAQRQEDANEAARQRQRVADEAALQRSKDRQTAANAATSQRRAETEMKEAQAAQDKAHADRMRVEREAREAEARKRQEALAADARRAQEKEEREAARQAERDAQAKAESKYLIALAAGTKLGALKCPGGEGRYFVVGLLPVIKPEVVSCVDVHFRARCDGKGAASDGVGTKFLGAATDCFMGDTYPIEPKPACSVERVRVEVREMRRCGT